MANANSDRMLAFQHADMQLSLDDFGTGCNLGQGCLFSKPISGEELEKQLPNQLAPVDKVLNIHRMTCE
jgi:EAL domain-containing protein (putative c-di-GMP-specific phosphodiesterase class I)